MLDEMCDGKWNPKKLGMEKQMDSQKPSPLLSN
jgi:hypothetical protein